MTGFSHALKFEKRERDFYRTLSHAAVDELAARVRPCRFVEPCAGMLDLVVELEKHGWPCVGAYDIVPADERVAYGAEIGEEPPEGADMSRLQVADTTSGDWAPPEDAEVIVTNPPWRRDFLEAALPVWLSRLPTILLLPSRYEHNRWFSPWLQAHGRFVLPVGRVKFIEKASGSGIFDATWFVFSPQRRERDGEPPIEFLPRPPERAKPARRKRRATAAASSPSVEGVARDVTADGGQTGDGGRGDAGGDGGPC